MTASSSTHASPPKSTQGDTTQAAGSSEGNVSKGSGAGVRESLRGMSYAEQVQFLAPGPPEPPPTSAAPSTTRTPVAGVDPGGDPGAWLISQWQSGREAFDAAVAKMAPSQVARALPALGDGMLHLLDRLWPSGTGWGVVAAASAKGTIAGTDIAFPCDIHLGGEGCAELTVSRSGGVVTLEVAVDAKAEGALAPSIKLVKMPCGTLVDVGQSMALAIDLAAVKWPTGAYAKLCAGNIQGAMGELLSGAVSLGGNAQVTTEGTGQLEGSVGGQVDGVAVQATAKAIAGLGLKVTLVSPTSEKAGSLEVAGDAGLFLGIEGETIKGSGLAKVRDFVSWLTTVDLSQMGETGARTGVATRLSAKVLLGAASRPSLPRLETVKLSLVGQLAAMFLGTGVQKSEATVSLVLSAAELPGFQTSIAERQGGSATSPTALGTGAAGANPPPNGPAGGQTAGLPSLTVEHKYVGTLVAGALREFLPQALPKLGLDHSTQGIAEVSFEVTCSLKSSELAPLARSLGKAGGKVLAALESHDVLAAVAALFALRLDLESELAAFVVASVDTVKLTSRAGLKRSVAGGTPGEGTVTGASGGASVGAFMSAEVEMDAASLGVPALVAFLRRVV